MKKKLYFAHPVNVFGTELKKKLTPTIEETFPGWEIEDPGQPHHQKGYAGWKKRLEGDPAKSGGMSYYYDEVLPHCRGCIMMSFVDGKVGAGVAGEAKFFVERGQPVFRLYIPRILSGPEPIFCGVPLRRVRRIGFLRGIQQSSFPSRRRALARGCRPRSTTR